MECKNSTINLFDILCWQKECYKWYVRIIILHCYNQQKIEKLQSFWKNKKAQALLLIGNVEVNYTLHYST